ncbi:ras-related protein Ral-B [Lingula anatina]|uniref:Ras-related protein Ral-B n=1 Tax=Lingula anatina TaxID=7574 RepID=A0A1S3HYK5_LINAN|nr:ras-related protein Ral-B [Lingula anatina]|eukprot:XP_013390164.1 ras-related protein Ral-B [Lingula anatina]
MLFNNNSEMSLATANYDDFGINRDFQPQQQQGDCCLVRSFSISRKGLLSRGDSVKRRSVISTGSSDSGVCSEPDLTDCKDFSGRHHVVVYGSGGVGRSALISQLTKSDSSDTDSCDESTQLTNMVVVELDDEEAELCFVESQETKEIPYADAYIITYSIDHRNSFRFARNVLLSLRQSVGESKPVLLVGCKSDLERTREVPVEDARTLAFDNQAKFIEVSVLLNFHVDELLVGTLTQIRLREKWDMEDVKLSPKSRQSSSKGAKGLVKRFLKRNSSKSKSCEDLYVH